MPLAISPRHDLEDFPNGLSHDDKVEVFIARVEGWLLGPAAEMVAKGVSHRGFALLMILSSYFEMIAKYKDGFVGEGKSAHYFKQGLLSAFPDLTLPDDAAFVDQFYSRIRNGLYHAGMTRAGVLLSDDIPGVIAYQPATGLIGVSPDRLAQALRAHFATYENDLRLGLNSDVRGKFERRFDSDNA